MATVNYTATSSFQEVTQAGTDKDFILQNLSGGVEVFAAFADSTPAESAPVHLIEPRGTLIRAGVAGKLYIRTASGTARCALTAAA